MKLVQHLLDTKGRQIIGIAPDASVFDAIKLMAEKAVGALLVMEGGELLGIITERDYARKVIIKNRSSETTRVEEIMTTGLTTASSGQSIDECMAMMSQRSIRHLPVVDDGMVVGVISMRDLVQAIIAGQQEEIEQLESYISG